MAERMALSSVREKDTLSHLHRCLGHMSLPYLKWHREHSKNAWFSDSEASKVRPICKSCAYGESRQTGTDHHRVHRPLPTIPGQCFVIDAFACTHVSRRGYRYCDLMRDGASQWIYCNFTPSRLARDVVSALSRTWDLNPSWSVQPPTPDPLNPRFVRMDSETAYKSQEVLSFLASKGYTLEFTPPRDKHAGGIAERMVGLVTSKANAAMMEYMTPPSFWCWAMYKASQDLNFNFNSRIQTSPYHFVTGKHVDVKMLHSFFSECYMFIPLHERRSKLPSPRAQRCRFLAYSFSTIMVPTYIVVPVSDTGLYGIVRTSKDIIFDESCVYDPLVDNSPSEAAFAELLSSALENVSPIPSTVSKPFSFHRPPSSSPTPSPTSSLSPADLLPVSDALLAQDSGESADDGEAFPLVLSDTDSIEQKIDQYGVPIYWSTLTSEILHTDVVHVNHVHYDHLLSMFNMETSKLPSSFREAFAQPRWRPAIDKEQHNFIDNTCMAWVKDVGQRRVFMKWLFSIKADLSLKARLVARGDRCKPHIDFDPDDVYCGNVAATSIKVFFALAARYGLLLRGGDLVGAYLVTQADDKYTLFMDTPQGFIAPEGMILQILGNVYGLPASGRNFSKAVDVIVLSLGYMNTPFDLKFFYKWIDGFPMLLMFHSDDFRWCGPPHLLAEWDTLVAAFEKAKYQVKDCTDAPFVGINVTHDQEGNYYLDQTKTIEGIVKAANLRGAKTEKLPYPMDGPSLSKLDNAANEDEVKESLKTPFRALIGMLSYIQGHTKPDIAYALNVLSRYCNNPGPRHVIFLRHLVKYCDYSKNDRLKFHAHHGPYDPKTMKPLTQVRFQCDADLAGNLDNSHSTTSYLGYVGESLVCSHSTTQGSLSTSTAESEIKAVNHCLKSALIPLIGMLNLMGFPQDVTIIEEDNQACVYASNVTHMTRNMKHLELGELYIKEKVDKGIVKLLKVASADNTSDIGTKRVPLPLFNKHSIKIMDKNLRNNL